MRRSSSLLMRDELAVALPQEPRLEGNEHGNAQPGEPENVDDEDRREAGPEEPRGRPNSGGRREEAARDREERPAHLPGVLRGEVERRPHAGAEVRRAHDPQVGGANADDLRPRPPLALAALSWRPGSPRRLALADHPPPYRRGQPSN
jgi:hypothetical protein